MSVPRSPFPGMDPYLEAPEIWPDLHDSLASEIRGLLNQLLPAPYYARLEAPLELGIVAGDGPLHRIVPDITVIREAATAYVASGETVEPRLDVAAGLDVRVRTDLLRHPVVEIRDPTRGHRLVTLIELVSPSNKRPGPDRRSYLARQCEVLESDANLVEIDLLRGGQRLLPYPDLETFVADLGCDYLVLVNRVRLRQDTWMDYTVFPVSIRDILPCVPVPLTGDDPDVPLDLQVAVLRAYADGPYHRAVDYSRPPDPPLDEASTAWANALLAGSQRPPENA